MIVVLSYIIAVILTFILAIVLYPIAALFWVFEMLGKLLVILFNVFGKVSDNMFLFTTKVIRHLWRDIKNMEQQPIPIISDANQWKCACGTVNTGKFCSECGAGIPVIAESGEKTDN